MASCDAAEQLGIVPGLSNVSNLIRVALCPYKIVAGPANPFDFTAPSFLPQILEPGNYYIIERLPRVSP